MSLSGRCISVVTPVYNAGRFIRQAVDSALAQPETLEVILIEDGSHDDTLSICEALSAADPRVRLLRHPGGVNLGAAVSRTLGVSAARGELVAFLDADDLFLPGRFSTTLRLLDQEVEVDGCYEAVGVLFDEASSEAWWRTRGRAEVTMIREHVAPQDLFLALVTGEFGHFCTDGVVVRKELFSRTGPFDASLRMCQDMAMWIKMAAVGRLVGGAPDHVVALRRLHGRNRIIEDEHIHREYERRMWELLLQWSSDRALDRSLRLALLDQLIQRTLPRRRFRSGPRGRLGELRALARVLFRYPFGLHSRYVRRRLVAGMGLPAPRAE